MVADCHNPYKMLLFNLLNQLNAMPINEATQALDALTNWTLDPNEDVFTWRVTIERHGMLQIAKITFDERSERFIVEEFAMRNSVIYKFHAVDNTFGEEIAQRIELAIKLEINYKLN